MKAAPLRPIGHLFAACIALCTLAPGLLAQETQPSQYLVVTVGLDLETAQGAGFQTVAEKARVFHNASLLAFDGEDFAGLHKELVAAQPKNVLFVIEPQLLDVNFHRQIFMLSPTLDDDLQADFSWGYLTAANAEDLGAFWGRIEGLHKDGLANHNWLALSVTSGMKSFAYPEGGLSPAAKAGGFDGRKLYFGTVDKDPEVLKFVDEHLPEMEKASIVTLAGNGDPHGVWLFNGQRNMEPSKHWKFAPEKVGHDPEGELVRIRSDRFSKLKLASPIMWSGTCHSGSTERVYVEGDIVATFGKSDKIEAYDLKPEDSLSLTWIAAGVGSLIVPIASNHGFSNSLEAHHGVTYGASLGETIKSTYDDVFMQANGVPKLLIVEGGKVDHRREPTMQSGGANRILIGDPALRIFDKAQIPIEMCTVESMPGVDGLVVGLQWEKGFHPEAWNMYADAPGKKGRMRVRVDLPEGLEIDADDELVITSVMTTVEGEVLESLPSVVLERAHGETYLHLQATTEAEGLMHGHHTVRFAVSW